MSAVHDLHARALQATTAIVANVNAEQFGAPTPCTAFDVLALLDHMVAGNLRFVEFAAGGRGEAVPATGRYVNGDALTPYRDSAEAVRQAWQDPALLETVVHLPIGDVPGSVALGIHTVEAIAHGWDLATATGQPTEIEPALFEAAWRYCEGIDDSLRGPGRPFGPAVSPPPGASDTDRLMAWLGRDP